MVFINRMYYSDTNNPVITVQGNIQELEIVYSVLARIYHVTLKTRVNNCTRATKRTLLALAEGILKSALELGVSMYP